jgi:hypothetical protein
VDGVDHTHMSSVPYIRTKSRRSVISEWCSRPSDSSGFKVSLSNDANANQLGSLGEDDEKNGDLGVHKVCQWHVSYIYP